MTNSRPNVLWVSFEDCSPRFGCYGGSVARTPDLDRLAGSHRAKNGQRRLDRHRHTSGQSPWVRGVSPEHHAEHRRAGRRGGAVLQRLCVRRALPAQPHRPDHRHVRDPQRGGQPRGHGRRPAAPGGGAQLLLLDRGQLLGIALLLVGLPHRVGVRLPVPPLGYLVDQRLHGEHEPDAGLRRRAGRRDAARGAALAGRQRRPGRLVPPRPPVGSPHPLQHTGGLREPVRRRSCASQAHRGGAGPQLDTGRPHSAQELWGFKPDEWSPPPPRHPWNLSTMDEVKQAFDGYHPARNEEMLFDISADPHETTDLADQTPLRYFESAIRSTTYPPASLRSPWS